MNRIGIMGMLTALLFVASCPRLMPITVASTAIITIINTLACISGFRIAIPTHAFSQIADGASAT